MVARRQAIRSLSLVRDERVRRSLERALTDPDPILRLAAAAALGSQGDPRSRLPLESALSDEHWNVRAQAAYALSRIKDQASTPLLTDRLERDASALVRNACALALAHLADARAIPSLERALHDESDRVRREAVIGLERSGDPEAAVKARPFLNDPARRVRIAAAVVLGVRRDRAAVPGLLDRLAHSEPWERPALVIALGRIGDVRGTSALVHAADDPMRSIRVCAVHALAQMHSPETSRVARRRLQDPAWSVRGAAALALGSVGSTSDANRLLPLLVDSHAWPRRCALYAVGQLGVRHVLPAVRPLLDDRDPEVKLAAIWALGRLHDVESRARLVSLLRRSRSRAARAPTTLTAGEGAVRLVSDAETRIFDALVDAITSLLRGARDPGTELLLEEIERTLPAGELDRPARRPSPLGAGDTELTLRALFEQARAPSSSPVRPPSPTGAGRGARRR